MATFAQQRRIDRLTREALGNPDYATPRVRVISAFVALMFFSACALAADGKPQVTVVSAAPLESGVRVLLQGRTDPLRVVQVNGASLTVELPAALPDGAYRLHVLRPSAVEEIDFTLGVVGPVLDDK